MRVAIIGQGYVGLTIAVGAAGAGHSVVGFDVNDGLVAALNAGTSHIEGIAGASIGGFIASGAYKASTQWLCFKQRCITFCVTSVCFFCVTSA